MKSHKLLAIVVLTALLSGSVLVSKIHLPFNQTDRCSCQAASVLAGPIISDSITNWQYYQDPDFNFTLEYPTEWKSETTIQPSLSLSNSTAIAKRQTFVGAEGLIDLDIWPSNGLDLNEWVEWYGKTRSPLPVTESNATIAGYPAIMFLEDGVTVDMLSTFFSDGKQVYRIWYTVTRNKVGLEVYWHLIEKFSLPGTNALSVDSITEDVKQESERAVENSQVINPLISSCCNYNSPGNPFPCCSNQGNCTWWVFYKYGYVPFRGDAWTWWSQVPNYSDWSRGGGPRRNQENIVWWNRSGSSSSGHVAYAANYTSGSTISITEMLWCASCYRARSISTSAPSGYIYERYPPQPQ